MAIGIRQIRINLLRVLAVLLLAVALSLDPVLLGTLFGRFMWDAGVILIFFGVLGRFWSILYVGGRKSLEVVSDGPYSICRHPLYLFSTMATLGFALMLQSLVFAAVLTLVIFVVLLGTAISEEKFLRKTFGTGYDDYAAKTPRILPRMSQFKTATDVSFRAHTLRINFSDALVFLALIPVAELINWWNGAGVLALIRIL